MTDIFGAMTVRRCTWKVCKSHSVGLNDVQSAGRKAKPMTQAQ